MSTNDNDNDLPRNDDDDGVADENVERLIKSAYRPEPADPDFLSGVKDRMLGESGPATPVATALPRWLAVAAALLLGLGVGMIASGPDEATPVPVDPSDVASVPRTDNDGDGNEALDPTAGVGVGQPVPRGEGGGEARPAQNAQASNGLGPRPRTATVAPERIAIGKAAVTRAGEKRMLTLPDGSRLFVDANTSVTLTDDRRLRVDKGRVFLEVAPDEFKSRFVVTTPDRDITAIGTRFAVDLRNAGATKVHVTHGKVRVSGIDPLLFAGQQLLASAGKGPVDITPAERSSHALEWTRDLAAKARTPLVPDSEYAGGALVAVDPYGQSAKLSLRKYHVDVHIEDGFARTTIDQTFFNHESMRMEGTFYFPLPAAASLSRLAMYVAGKRMEGGMSERRHAREVYETIRFQRRDPALLEWVDGSTFKMRVFPLEARQEKRIVLSYTERLPAAYGTATYRFPAGHSLGVVGKWSARLRVANAAGSKWDCESHDLKTETVGNDLFLSAAATAVKPETDLVVQVPDVAGRDGDTRIAVHEHEGLKYLMLRHRIRAKLEPAARAARDWVVLFESSGNRDPLLARAQIDVVEALLKQAEKGDTLYVVTAGTRVRAFSKERRDVTPAEIKRALAFLEGTHLIGAMDLGNATATLKPVLDAAANPYLVHVGTGVASLGELRHDVIVKSIPVNAKYVGVAVGKRWSRPFMRLASRKTGGVFTQINPDEDVAWRAFELASKLDAPLLTRVRVADELERQGFLLPVETLAHGEELLAVTRLEPGAPLPETLTISGLIDGETYTAEIPVKNVVMQGAGYLPRTWAKLEIDRLIAEGQVRNKKAITKLSMSSYVMSPYTSLLVLEDDAMYERFKVDRGRTDHWALYPAPEKIDVVYEPDPDRPTWRRPIAQLPDGQKPTPKQVLDTILVKLPPRLLQNPYYGYGYGYQAITAYQYLTGGHLPQGQRWARNKNRTEGLALNDLRKGLSSERLTELGIPGGEFRMKEAGAKKPAGMPMPSADMGGLAWTHWDLQGAGKSISGGDGSFALRGPAAELAPMSRSATFMPMQEMNEAAMWVGDRLDFESRGAPQNWQMPADPSVDFLMRDEASAPSFFGGNQVIGIGGSGGAEFSGGGGGRGGGRASHARRSFRQTAGRLRGQTRYNGYYGGHGGMPPGLMYYRPYPTNDQRLYRDLIRHAPGMNTTFADLRAAIDAEAKADPRHAPGLIDEAAAELIARARGNGWMRVTIPATKHAPAFDVRYDGTGRHVYTRTLFNGLVERVVCDGVQLLQIYPELGVGSKRAYGRFHRNTLHALVPWMLPPVEELARGNDVTLGAEGIVFVSPRLRGKDPKDGYYRAELQFGSDGRLVERRIVLAPKGKVLVTQHYAPSGIVTTFDAEGKKAHDVDLHLTRSDVPGLRPDVSDQVVVPMPLRTYQHIQSKLAKRGNQWEKWDEETAIHAIASYASQQNWQALQIAGRRFFVRGDRRIGFHTILASGLAWNPDQEYRHGKARWKVDPLEDHPDLPLAKYLGYVLHSQQKGFKTDVPELGAPKDGLLDRVSKLTNFFTAWQYGRAWQGDKKAQDAWRKRSADFVETHPDAQVAWAGYLTLVNRGGDQNHYKRLAKIGERFEKIPGLGYTARYTRAQLLANSGQWKESKAAFVKLYGDAIGRDVLPALDHQFRSSLQQGEGETWPTLMRETTDKLLEKKAYRTAVYLAWQCQYLGDQLLAEEILNHVLAETPAESKFEPTLAAVEFLRTQNQFARADALFAPLLEREEYQELSEVWWIAASLAQGRGMMARALEYQERAMDLEFDELPEFFNLQTVRQGYQQLFVQFNQLANAVAALGDVPSESLMTRVVRSADRWRALDPDDTQACQAAARVLGAMGATELAWDYLTTPLAERPNESAPWAQMALMLKQQGEFELSQRCYETAFRLEDSNAQYLWDRATLLQQLNRPAEAKKLYRQLADGTWQPRFRWLHHRAKQYAKRK